MKSHMHTRALGSFSGSRKALNGSLPYMSERQMQAYLMARDAIRRIQRTSSIVNAFSANSTLRPWAVDKRQSSN